MLASLAALAPVSALLRLSLRETASTLSTQLLASIAALVQMLVP